MEAAVLALDEAGLKVIDRSAWWRSNAWPDPAQPAFLNGVVLIESRLAPADLLERLHEIEAAFGRDRSVVNAPRTLDLDLIAYGRTMSASPALPHPRSAGRLFVMGPLAQVAPHWRHPTLKRTANELAAGADQGLDAHPI